MLCVRKFSFQAVRSTQCLEVPIAHGGLPFVDSEVRQSSTFPVDTRCFTWTIVSALVSLIHAQLYIVFETSGRVGQHQNAGQPPEN